MNHVGDTERIAITMGDPAGIGPEIIVRTIEAIAGDNLCVPVVVANAGIMAEACEFVNPGLQINRIKDPGQAAGLPGTIDVLHLDTPVPENKAASSADGGRAAVMCIREAVAHALNGSVRAIVTAPVSKESLHLAGFPWPGHTELLAELTGTSDFAMMFFSEGIKVILCTIHIALRDVPAGINEHSVFSTIRLAALGARMMNINEPSIAVSGLNPHAGEAGVIGSEEDEHIIPAIERARECGMNVSGPFPPDVIFHRAYQGEFDIIVCMYHDQGLIPFKMIAFDKGVNVTVGLPIIRTSPDHGTAFDIAWKNRAEPTSMIEAVKLAAALKMPVSG